MRSSGAPASLERKSSFSSERKSFFSSKLSVEQKLERLLTDITNLSSLIDSRSRSPSSASFTSLVEAARASPSPPPRPKIPKQTTVVAKGCCSTTTTTTVETVDDPEPMPRGGLGDDLNKSLSSTWGKKSKEAKSLEKQVRDILTQVRAENQRKAELDEYRRVTLEKCMAKIAFVQVKRSRMNAEITKVYAAISKRINNSTTTEEILNFEDDSQLDATLFLRGEQDLEVTKADKKTYLFDVTELEKLDQIEQGTISEMCDLVTGQCLPPVNSD